MKLKDEKNIKIGKIKIMIGMAQVFLDILKHGQI